MSMLVRQWKEICGGGHGTGFRAGAETTSAGSRFLDGAMQLCDGGSVGANGDDDG